MTICNENFRRVSLIRAEIIDSVYADCETCGTENVAIYCVTSCTTDIISVSNDYAKTAWDVATLALSHPHFTFYVMPA